MTTPAKPKTKEDFQKLAKSRHNAELLAESMRRSREIEQINARPLPGDNNLWESLTNEEIMELSRIEQLEAARKNEMQSNVQSYAQWCMLHPDVPANAATADKIVQYCRARGWSLCFANLDRTFAALTMDGTIRPDFSKRNQAAHESNFEELRSVGIRLDQPPDPNTADPATIREFYKQQPSEQLTYLVEQNGAGYDDF